MSGHKHKRRKKRKLIVFIIEIVILVLVLGALFFYSKLDKLDIQDVDQEKIEVNQVAEETVQTFEGNKTIAVFGLDNRTQGVYTRGNSDVIMLLNVNNDTKEVSMVSVYRDTYLNVAAVGEDKKFRKANSAYAYGGAEQAITMLNRNLDVEIDNYVAVDFKAVAEAIDILGGVEIEITSEKEMGYLNDYIQANNGILGGNSPLVTQTGVQTLDGIQAVAYSRIRYTAGGDFKRAERQRRVFSEMMKKAKRANLAQVNELIDIVFPDVQTDLSKKDIITMASAVLKYDMSNSGGFPYGRTTDTPSKAIGSIVIPCSLESNVIRLHEQLYGTQEYTPSETVKEYSKYIINLTGKDEDDAVDDDFASSDEFNGNIGTENKESEDGE